MIRLIVACIKAALLQAILVPALLMFLVNESVQHVSGEIMPHKVHWMTWVHYLKSQLKGHAMELWVETRSWKVKGRISRWKHHGPRLFKRKRMNIARVMCTAYVAYTMLMAEALQAQSGQPNQVSFDSDAFALYVDNGATTSISNRIEDFKGPVQPINRELDGVESKMRGLSIGTIKWNIDDDDAKMHTFRLPGSIYAPQVGKRLLSPQHMAQVAKDNKPNKNGTWCGTYEDSIVLHWDQSKYKRTCPLDKTGSNIGRIAMAAGYRKMVAFCADCKAEFTKEKIETGKALAGKQKKM